MNAKSCILITANSNFGAALVLMLVELSLQQFFCFFDGDIDCNPSLILGMDNSSSVNAEVNEPFLDIRDGFLFWREHVVNLLRGPMFAKLLRIGIRSGCCQCHCISH